MKITKSWAVIAGVVGCLGITAASAGSRAQLAIDNVKQLRTMPLMVIYQDPDTPLNYYISWRPPMPALPPATTLMPADRDSGTAAFGGNQINPMAGAAGAAAQALVQELVGPGDIMGAAAKRLGQFMPMLSGLPLADEEYATARDVVASVAWLGGAPSQRVVSGGARPVIQSYMRSMSPRAVVVVSPSVRLRDDMNELVVVYTLNIYTRDYYSPRGSCDLLTSAVVGAVRTEGSAGGFPIVNYYESGEAAAILDKSVPAYFSDGGRQFHQDFDETLASAKSQLLYYFTGSDMPASSPLQGSPTTH